MPYKNKEDRNKRIREKYLTEKHPCRECRKPTGCELCRSCAGKRAWRLHPATNRPQVGKKGHEHFNWKGGRVNDGRGYILIYSPDHPRAKAKTKNYIPEHILVWEQANDKFLPKGWVVHHLNGIKDDNRPANLKAFPNRKHCQVLQAKAKRIQELEALLNHQGHLL